MASLFTLRALMALATRIGANPGKAISRSNISFLGKGPTKNPLFQSRLAGLENARPANLGDPKKLFEAIDDAVGWAKDGKLNGIQTEILGHNLTGIEKVLHPPPLPVLPNITDMATRTRNLDIRDLRALRSGVDPKAPGYIRQGDPITSENFGASQFAPSEASLKARELAKREGLGRFPKESHRFFGRPLKSKDFSEIDRMIMEGKIPDARGRTWNFKTPETGTFKGWTPKVVPKRVNIPASKINHQMIADKYGIDVELIKGKDWIEVLEIIKGFTPLKHGGLARILEV